MTSQNSSQWDLGRFVKTLSYFGAVPLLSRFDWFQQWFGSRPDPTVDSSSLLTSSAPTVEAVNSEAAGVILVVGATGGVGKRVVQRLMQRGVAVRTLVRDADRARAMLGESVPLIEADITIPETLTPAVMENVSAVICCSGTRVQPVEGDTPNREKYYQGIKFYLPEVVDTPEVVEYQGLQNLVQAAGELGLTHRAIFDFTQPSDAFKEIWGALDDVVMGGVSESSLRLADGVAYFSGVVSTANSGGFASVRTRNLEPALDLSQYDGVELRVKGDGKRYKFMLRSETRWDGVAYCASFDTVPDRWVTVRLPFTSLIPVFRAKTVNVGPVDTRHVSAFQLMLSKFEYDGALNPHFEPGFFQLQIESIRVYRQSEVPKFVLVSSAGVTRPGKPGLNLDEEPPAVRLNDQLGGILTWKLKGEDMVRQSGIPYTILRPCALTEEPGGQPLRFEQGDTLTGKVSREDIAELCIQALALPQARNVTVEIAEGEGGCAVGDWECLFGQVKADR
ncbi:MAG: CIA30 family protein [Synechococcales cyanobacterium M58_A2018_015]|nr:CIA30 family protein [Synechococcales cyanobacterium M58_A2018_015]